MNEATLIGRTLLALQTLRAAGHEVIVVDGGSADDSVILSQLFADRVIGSRRGRSRQMNAGTDTAKGELLLFLHADTFLPRDAAESIIDGLRRERKSWGHFDVRLSGRHYILRIVERLMNWRSRITGIATGDQAIFVRRDLFRTVGSFPDIDLMEDIALSKKLKSYGRPLCLKERVVTSSRRWEENGVLRTILQMWRLRLSYYLGTDTSRLAQRYEIHGSS